MFLRPLTAGVVLTALLFAIFLWLGPLFFLDGRRPFQINFTVGALAGLVIGIVLARWHVTVAIGGLRAAALVAIPGMLVMAAVGSHFQVFFPALTSSFIGQSLRLVDAVVLRLHADRRRGCLPGETQAKRR